MGIHIFNNHPTQIRLIEGGATNYSIVYDMSGSDVLKSAVAECQRLFYAATGIQLPVADGNILFDENICYISIGVNEFQKSSGIVKTEELTSNGYIIKTKGKSIMVLGGSDIGTLFGVYELMTQLFSYMSYSPDCFYIDKDVKNKNLPLLDVFDTPDIELRLANYGIVDNDMESAHRMRMLVQTKEVYINSDYFVHNTKFYLPESKYKELHPKWYSKDVDQLCGTCQGDEAEYEAMVAAMTEEVKVAIEREPDKRVVTITQMDNKNCCQCEHCKAERGKYGDAESALNNRFVNRVAENIYKWIEDNALPYDITIGTFAYLATDKPPAYKNEQGEWKIYDESVRVRDDVSIIFAPLDLMEFNHTLEEPENKKVKEKLDGWGACCKHFSIWAYQTCFADYFMPWDTYEYCQNHYKKYIELGALWIFDQGQHNNLNSPHFSMLKLFLNSQWGWDVTRDYNVLADGFFEYFYGKKDGAMRKFYEDMRAYMKYLDKAGLTKNYFAASNWPKELADRYLQYVDQAYQEIEKWKEQDEVQYQLFVRHIKLESMTPRYWLLKYHSANYTETELYNMRKAFAADCRELHINRMEECRPIENLIGEWEN